VNPATGVADDLLAPTELVTVDGGKVSTLMRPKAGRAYQRPVQHREGMLCWVDLPAVVDGQPASSDLHSHRATIVVDGAPLTPPRTTKPGWLGPTTTTWAAVGHAEWSPDGRLILAAKVEERLAWWPFPLAQQWRTFTCAPDGTRALVVREGWAEPSLHREWGLAVAKVDGRTVDVPGLGVRFDVPGDQAYDPYVSPDGRHVVCLVRGRRWGLWLVNVGSGSGHWLVAPEDRAVECSHARWLDDGSVIAACKTDSPWFWSLWRLGLDGTRDRLTFQQDGSVEQPFPT